MPCSLGYPLVAHAPTSPATQLQGPLLHPRTHTWHRTCNRLVAGGWRQQQLTRWQAINKPPVQMYLQSKYELRIRHVCYVVFYPLYPVSNCLG